MTDERLALFSSLRRVVEASECHTEAVAAWTGAHRSDATALLHVHQADVLGEPVGAGELARVTHLSRPATSALLARLERSGHLARAADPRDARRVVVRLTDRGRAVLTGPVDELLGAIARALDGHEPGALRAAAAVLDDVAAAVESAEAALRGRRPH